MNSRRSIILRNKVFLDSGNAIFEIFYLRFINPYFLYFKHKFFRKKKIFYNEFSKKIDEFGYSILPLVNCDNIDFLKINYSSKLQRSDNYVNVNKALEFATKLKFNEIVKDYFKESACNFTSSSWNTNPFQTASGITKWHRDRDGHKVLKFFVYLKDTDIETGPHIFAINSHKEKFIKFIPQFRYDDAIVEKYYKKSVTFCGPKGFCFVEDTTGLHKGTPPKKNYRSILDFTYYTGKVRWDFNTLRVNL